MFNLLIWCSYVTLACIFMYLDIKQEAIIPLTILLIIDIITGVIKAIRIKEEVTSKKWILWPLSKLSVLFIPFVIGLIWQSQWVDMSRLLSWFFAVASLYTWYSSLANVYMIYTGRKVTEYDATTAIFKFVLSSIESQLKKVYPDR